MGVKKMSNENLENMNQWKEEIIVEGTRYQLRKTTAPSGQVFFNIFGGFSGIVKKHPLRIPVNSLSDLQELRDLCDFVISDPDLKKLFMSNSSMKFKKYP
jgi:hypothetical protein